MTKVIKTTFDEEQRLKDEAFLALTPLLRWEYTYRMRQKMYKPGVNYPFKEMKVTVKKLS